MIYLDYAADTPVDVQVLDLFCQINQVAFGNANGTHLSGKNAKQLIKQATIKIKNLLNCSTSEVIYTSGATEANNLAIKGVARNYREVGRHIISTCLEHASVSGSLKQLQSIGYEIDLVSIRKDGTVDLDHLNELIREDTILVSINYVDSELGICQPIPSIATIVAAYPNCFFHVDATQAVGKIPIHLDQIDLVTFSPHKFFGLNGMGVLLKSESLILEPQIHGGTSTSYYRSGTPFTAGAGATALALELCMAELKERLTQVTVKNDWLKKQLSAYPLVAFNSTGHAIPHILNLSVKGVKAQAFQAALSDRKVCISIKSACSTDSTPSRSVLTVTGSRDLARSSWRISLCHLTTDSELQEFMDIFDYCYKSLTKK
ncbi:cysteine desulfurase [Acetobacterium wieringae]|uniref:Cysteine desulfurase n=1 Tax=Acetobacterium wieringae TaxID=52694 RepID=A0ABY6HAL5_9FIRM|nr:cysteine desulfurase family protein [Acetobacterium wieringae]UYO61550.1 cysteine desulfurase [Acetobacterium wieringae]VUZ28368.1 Cysteine desulfurase IscS [Acetobacterium wieringae]